ncbi:4-hydroxybenzoyl-CoA thioesterase [Pseudoalteromonas citrea]|uniref:4-hydroxybenzoyl-CoA thioesterase n=1 Tax=Pseudoalteromonas citrea TaxID=43655 RepID=A0A5S3XKT2_9GAMM|nr:MULTISPECIES: acyl-CoA thioesterase [Pseudoalteromonas]RJE77830.1 4-hydroxybenzoyl-CoA thioesterase [Pseudoalteromonas sp. MSK9-3]TMP44081.1 4-hydroxybenzoyl-CoA thioesterase [Pseudoalteromonas citrea]TMP55652.1 4-hydroxybenzoyl-CoA thioesterase [Pseudoalteromonas citrea]
MTFSVDLKVRDYECDLQGIVNNSVYFNYLEHARHEFLLSKGVDFAELAARNVNLVVIRSEVDYKSSLKPGDMFTVEVKAERVSKLKSQFLQKIVRKADGKLMLNAVITWTSVNEHSRPYLAEEISCLFD